MRRLEALDQTIINQASDELRSRLVAAATKEPSQ
jgi:hypothetical protein